MYKYISYGMPDGVSKVMAIAVLVINILLPGGGTLLAAFSNSPCSSDAALVALLQFLTAAFIVGWVWAILWGAILLQQSISGDGAGNGATAREQADAPAVKKPDPVSTEGV